MKVSITGILAALNAVTALLDAGVAGANVKIYTGAPPADTSVAPSGTLLGTVVCDTTAFLQATDNGGSGLATANDIAVGTAIANGTAGWFRAEDANGLAVIDGTVGQGSGELNLDDNTLVINDNINVIAWTVALEE